MRFQVDWPVFDGAAGGMAAEKVIVLPVLEGSYRSGNKAAAAVRAYVCQMRIDAFGAEGAFVATDARFLGVGR